MIDAFARVPALAAQHLLLAMAALALALLIALPLGVRAARAPRLAGVVLGTASLIQTIPSLALLALFYPVLLWVSSLVGGGVPALGFLPALLALTLYALLPIVRNLVTGFAALDPAVLEAADGIGMTPVQKLARVEAPLVLPIAMAGVRTAAVWTIGAATLSTTVGQPSLGDLIFAGLQTQNWVLVLAGCIASAGLALVADALLGLIEKGLATRRRMLTFGGLAAVLLGILGALTVQFGDRGDDRIVIGAKGFSEQYILARLIGQRLQAEGFSVEYRDGLGSAIAHQAVSTGAIDVLVDYTGTIWTNQMERSDNPDRETMLAEITAWETRTSGTHVLGRLGFENAYGLAMPRAAAEAGGFASIGDLAGRAQGMTIGGDPEFFERPEWIAVREAYGLRFAARRNFSPTFMYNALTSGEADVIGAYTSDGRIAADDLVILDDPEGAFPNYDAIILLAPATGTDDALVAALEPLVGAISVEAMREANYSVDRDEDKLSFGEAARRLAERIGG